MRCPQALAPTVPFTLRVTNGGDGTGSGGGGDTGTTQQGGTPPLR
ncbi:hypothetical protein [Streptomyces sp. NPDC006551]